ncbi:MAG: glycosyl hydrolase [Geminicoccaceae bacterium]|nr:glycosyl hydrolase [Geminicoccaceae bacterium]
MRELALRSVGKRLAAIAGLVATVGLGWADFASAQPTWPSGMNCHWYSPGMAAFETWRGSRFSALHHWMYHDTWANMVRWVREVGSPWLVRIREGRLISVSVPLLPNESKGQLAQCAAGAFDVHFRRMAQDFVAIGAGDAIIRLGAEANGWWQAYSINGNYDAYKGCFRRAVQVMRSVAPNLKFEWPMNREVYANKYQTTASRAYPGDDVVDIVGMSYYDMWPAATSEAVWNSSFAPELNFYANFARSRGKKLGFGEWGLGKRDGGGFDNPFFMRKMFDFFRANASLIAYETVFNCGPGTEFRIYPETWNPQAALAYRTLW